MRARLEIPRGFLVSAVAAGAGSMLGALLNGGNPLGGLSLFPFTLFGAVAVLLPSYLWLRDVRNASIRTCYTAVGLAGVVGGWFMLNALTSFHAFRNGHLGAVFGFSTALCWVAAHHLTRHRTNVP